ncbi:uncharacterized protein LOC120351964 [Nilaparvata lugens]|uniref:uncharacterized protein LOC120351964 n=1 Tax=Nilaparvata lugens TaxID=108931 RepID=UPI00193D71A5|nr:uncharacterized protein LOC120351964 [Nilaparvata lugens]
MLEFGNPQDSINQDEAAGQNYDSHIERGSDLSVLHDIAENVDYEAEIFNQSQILASCGTDGKIHYNDNIEDTSNLLDSSIIMEYEMISNWQDENSVIANTSCNEDDISSVSISFNYFWLFHL